MKKQLVFALLVVAIFYGNAQTTDYYDRMEHVFGNIDKTKVTTGFLKEFGIRFNEVEIYNGVISTNNFSDKTQWQSLYSSLYTMRVGTVAVSMSAPNTVFNNLKTQQSNSTEDVLFAVQYYTYQQYKTNAYTNGDVTVNNDQIFDVTGRNPYDTKTIFAVAPLKKQLQGDTFTFKLPNSLIYTNTSLTLNQVQIDFDDGNGYQTITLNTAKSVTYTSGGEKDIKVKFVYANGPTLYSQSKIWVDYIDSGGGQQARFNGFGSDVVYDEEPIPGANWQGSSATGLVTVELAPGHTQLTKPLIVIEGFDPDNRFNYFSFINSEGTGGVNIDIDPTGDINTLNQAIEDEDYDLVFVDFANSTDYIQRNAYMVKEVINWVNTNKVGTEQNVVLGMSMGGLVARYALRHMELNSETHDTKLYISHDTPHQGANMPIAYQAMVRHLVGEDISIPVFFSLFDVSLINLEDIAPDLEFGLDLLQTPVVQQMLIYQLQGTGDNVSINTNTLHSSFSTEYSNMGYPQQNGIRNIAIANGSECGTPLGFADNATLVDVDEKIGLSYFSSNILFAFLNALSLNPLKFLSSVLSTNIDIKAQFNLKALPKLQSKQIYKGKIFIKKTVLFVINIEEPLIDEETVNSSSSMLPLDNANGGIYDIEEFITLPQILDNSILEKQFNFIPTFSSLDIGGGNQTIGAKDLNKIYSPLSPPSAPKNSPFDNFYTNPLSSEIHTQFTLINGNWLMDELEGNIAFYSCASTCSEDLSIAILGEDQICNSTSETYTLNNIQTGVPISWSISPAGGFTITSSGNSVTLTPTGNFGGEATLIASISTDCSAVEIEKQIQTGSQRPIIYDGNGNEVATFTFCALNYDGITFNTPPGTVEWEWTNVSNNFAMTASNNSAQFYNSTPTSGIVTVRVRDNCGWGTPTFLVINLIDCSGGEGFSFRASPNPVTNVLHINKISQGASGLNTSYLNTNASNNDVQNSSATLYDLNGNYIVSRSPARGNLNLQSVQAGHYILVITYGDEYESHHIIIE